MSRIKAIGSVILVAPISTDEVSGTSAEGISYRGTLDPETGLLLAPDRISHHEAVVLGSGPRAIPEMPPGTRVLVQADRTARWEHEGLTVQSIQTSDRCSRCGRDYPTLPILAVVSDGGYDAPEGRVMVQIIDEPISAAGLEILGDIGGATEVALVLSGDTLTPGDRLLIRAGSGARWTSGARRYVSLRAGLTCRCGLKIQDGDVLATLSQDAQEAP